MSKPDPAHSIFYTFAPSLTMQDTPKSRFQIFKKNGLTINSLMDFIHGDPDEETPEVNNATEDIKPKVPKFEELLDNNSTGLKSSGTPLTREKTKIFKTDETKGTVAVKETKKADIDLENEELRLEKLLKSSLKNMSEASLLNLDGSKSGNSCKIIDSTKKSGGGEDHCTDILPFLAHNAKGKINLHADSDHPKLPEVIELTNNNFSKADVIQLDPKTKSDKNMVVKKESTTSIFSTDQELVSSMTTRLNESYQLQEELAAENRALESSKYQLEEQILLKEGDCEKLQSQVDLLTNEVRELKENAAYLTKVQNKSNEEHNIKILSEANWLEKEIKRLHVELNSLKLERDALQSRKATTRNFRGTDFGKADQESELFEALSELKKVQEECENIKAQLNKTLEENKNLIKRESELVQARTEVANNAKLISETNTKLQELVAEKKISLEEMEDMRSVLEDRFLEMQEYRKKYLQAQQRVEELNCELNEKQSEIVAVRRQSEEEIRIVKVLYQEKVAGIDAITATMKEMQVKLYENQQQKLLLEAGMEEAKRELEHVMDKNTALVKSLEDEKLVRAASLSEKQKLEALIIEIEERNSDARKANTELQSRSARLDEAISHLEVRLAEKTKEAAEAMKSLEEAKQDSTRQINRIKERSESSRRNLQVQLAENERELAGARAAVKTAHKERDEIRHKLQSQINTLTENLEEGQKRWKGLQAHVSALQTSLCPNATMDQKKH